MAPSPHRLRRAAPRRRLVAVLASAALAVPALLLAAPGAAQAAAPHANEPVSIWLTTTDDSGGRHVTRGLQQQNPIAFSAGTGGSGTVVSVDENTKYQQFTGGGASFTDTAAWLMNSSGALSSTTRNQVMTKLFDPASGIGLGFLRNPMGASDLARSNYTYDDMPSGQTDPSLAHFSIAHDQTDVLPLTKQAEQLNPALKVMATPWSAPPWMKDNGAYSQGWLQSQYYAAYAQYFVKYVQAYQAQGVHVDFVSPQNEPTCCSGYPSTQWNGSGLDYFTGTDLLPAFHAAGLSTKVLALDWNWSNYDEYGAPTVNDAAVRNDSLFGGIAWHGYDEGSAAKQTDVHNQYPGLDAYDTEHSGGTWVGNQQNEDMSNIIDYTRNWGKSVVKWSLAVDQNMGPHNGGCDKCSGLITVHNGDGRSGQVDYNVEYYDMGQLTKFVRSGATRIASTASSTIPNVAWRNPDGSKALVAYNGTSSAQPLTVNWGGETFTYSVPASTAATFIWAGTQSSGGSTGHTGRITGYGGKCADVASAGTADGTAIDLYTCNGTTAQSWTVGGDGTLKALNKCMDVTSAGTSNGTQVQLYTCNGSGSQVWQPGSGGTLVNPQSGRCLDATGPSSADGTRLQIWDCTGAANQQWQLPS